MRYRRVSRYYRVTGYHGAALCVSQCNHIGRPQPVRATGAQLEPAGLQWAELGSHLITREANHTGCEFHVMWDHNR